MKTITKEREVKTLNLGESVSFGIDSSDGLAYVFGILRDSLYSDKTKAAIREYSTNAYDQHVACGIPNRPIEVTFPTRFDPYLKIRNFGRGLSKKEINTIYCYYGKSQKRDSNLYNGQLGIGSKSAFAYGENFLINTFIKGKKTSYNAWIDESDIGKITVLSSEKSSEENGTEIVIPVNEYDIDVRVRYRNNKYFDEFQSGWSLHSLEVFYRILQNNNFDVEKEEKFFPNCFLEPKKDPARSWMVKMPDDTLKYMNGLSQIYDSYVIEVVKGR